MDTGASPSLSSPDSPTSALKGNTGQSESQRACGPAEHLWTCETGVPQAPWASFQEPPAAPTLRSEFSLWEGEKRRLHCWAGLRHFQPHLSPGRLAVNLPRLPAAVTLVWLGCELVGSLGWASFPQDTSRWPT